MTRLISREMLGWFVVQCHDNGGATADRYTIGMRDGDHLCLSEDPSSPHGISQWGQGEVDGNVQFSSLPPEIRNHVHARIEEAYGDFIQDSMDDGRSYHDVMEEVLRYARDGRELELPEDFGELVARNAPMVDRHVLEAAGQLPLSMIEPSFEWRP
jgi:hypothetical protein